ncbi:hypothetical protein, partial [Psychrobacillus sp. BL-248-WT-3]|uniref:hypothetical protein n=1 Tax=Psychrobacillus sp. BL-248-WT-3 TaxID=2725306 RepID=UPI00197CEC72
LPRQANGKKRGGRSSATAAFFHLTPRGKAPELDNQKSIGAYPCPDRLMGKSESTYVYQFQNFYSFLHN